MDSSDLLQAQNGTSPTAPTGITKLHDALETGATNLRQQIRYVMMVSQVNNKQPMGVRKMHHPKTLTQARYRVLSQIADTLSQSQIESIVADIQAIDDSVERWLTLFLFIPHMQLERQRTLVQQAWRDIKKIDAPENQAELIMALVPHLSAIADTADTPSPLLQILAQAQSVKNTEARIRSLIALAPYLPPQRSEKIFKRVLDELERLKSDIVCGKSLVMLAPHLSPALLSRVMTVVESINTPFEQVRALIALARYQSAQDAPQLHTLALETIDAIDSDDDRAEALIGFTPNLQSAQENLTYPHLLEKALTIAIMLARRELRARVLVALAPHLTTDLQGEALAAVHSLSDERERALLLAELAQHLPSDMLVASLAVAHSMQERDARLIALMALAEHVPEHAHERTLNDAYDTANGLPHLFERVQALIDLKPLLPEAMQHQAMTAALDAAETIDNPNAQSRALSILGTHLPESLVERAFNIAASIERGEKRLNALLSITPRLTGDAFQRAIDMLFACISQMPLEYKRARALINIAPVIPVERLPDVEELAYTLVDAVDRVNVLTTIAQHLSADKQAALVRKTYQQLNFVDTGYDRALILSTLTPMLPDDTKQSLTGMILETLQTISDDYDRASAFTLLVPILADITQDDERVQLPDKYVLLRQGLLQSLKITEQNQRTAFIAQGAAAWVGGDDQARSFALWRDLALALTALPIADVVLTIGALLPIFNEMSGESSREDIAYLLGLR